MSSTSPNLPVDPTTGGTGSHATGTGNVVTGTGTGHGTGTLNTATGLAGQTRMDVTAMTLTQLTGPTEMPDLGKITGLRLHQQLLAAVVLMVVLVVGLSGLLSIISTERQFKETSEQYITRFQDQARELGATISHTVSLFGAGSLRDNNYGMLGEIVRDITKDNPNVVRLRVLDSDGLTVADSDKNVPLGTHEERKRARTWTTSASGGRPVFEYQEPVDYGSETGKGLVVLSYSLDDLQRQLRELETSRAAAVAAVTRRTVLLALAFVAFGVLGAVLLSRRIARSLGTLTEGAMRLAQGDLSARVGEAGGAREVKTLGVVFNYMGDRLVALLESVRSKAALEREMQLARQVQNSLLPSRDPVVLGSVRLAGACVSADACGGDWWMYQTLENDRLVLGIGDVTGHGLSTALIATSATSGFAAAMKLREASGIEVGMLISSLNQTLHSVAHGQHQMSSALAIVNLTTGELEYAAGGHPPAAVVNRHLLQLNSLPVRGALLGQSAASTYQPRKTQLNAGDIVVWYTDGLTEARDADGKLYGVPRLGGVVQRSANLTVEQIRDAILADVQTYSEGRPQQDDITVIVLEYTGSVHRA